MPPEPQNRAHDPRVFVEIGIPRGPGASEQLDTGPETSAEAPVEAWTVAHIVAREDQLSAIGVSDGREDRGEALVGELLVRPHFSDVPPAHVRLEITLRDVTNPTAAPESGHGSESVAAETSLVLRDQQTIVVSMPANASRPSQTLIVTPYLIRSDADLQRLLECSLEARADAVLER